MAKKAAVMLSFHNIVLRQSDVQLLSGPHWLNDTIISFYFEYLEKVIFNKVNELLFVSPEVTQCIKMVQTEEIKIFLDPLGINQKQFVFFPLNDNDSPDTAGGSHWSLLVYSKPESSFFHFDSSCVSNHNAAWEFASHLIPYLTQTGSINFADKECLQQTNGYDCGIHVLCNVQRLAEHAHNTGQIGNADMTIKVDPSAKRKQILNIINNLRSSQ